MQWLWWIGGVAVALLAMYAVYLWMKVWQQEKAITRAQDERVEQLQGQLAVMTRAVLTEQVNLTEGVLRIAAMLHTIEQPLNADVAAIHEMADVALQFDIGEARKRLPREERERQDKIREELEKRYEVPIKAAVERLQKVLPAGVINKMTVTH